MTSKKPGFTEYDPKRVYTEEDYYKLIRVPDEEGGVIEGILWNVTLSKSKQDEMGTNESKRCLQILLKDGNFFVKRLERTKYT